MALEQTFTGVSEDGLHFSIRFGGARLRRLSVPLWKAMTFPVRPLFLSALPVAVVWVPVQLIWNNFGSSGIGSSPVKLQELTSGAEWLSGQRFSGSSFREEITEWVNSLGLDITAE